MSLQGMTQDKWNALSPAQRDAVRDNSGLTLQLIGLEGYKVRVTDHEGGPSRTFIVGKSTGWRPCHLELSRVSSHGGGPACERYFKVETIRKIR